MAGVGFTITPIGMPEVTRLLSTFTSPETRRTLHQRWGIQAVNWVDENFRTQGSLTGTRWAALRPSTVAAKGSRGILLDSGRLKNSFVAVADTDQVAVGSPLEYAQFHEEGRTGPWAIRPRKPDGVLAWKGPDGKMRFAKLVMHPGYPQRRILPRQEDKSFMDRLRVAADNLFQELRGA